MSLPTLLDIAKMNGSDALVGLIEEAARPHPAITGESRWAGKTVKHPNVGAARTIKGINYKTLVRTATPTVSFRAANEGTAVSKSTFENRLVETFILEPVFEVDVAVADRHEDGPEAYLAIEAAGIMEASLALVEKCFFYGTNGTHGDAKAFPGLLQAYDATNMVVDAGGTTATTGSSVWAVRFGPQHVQWVWGNGGKLDLSEVSKVRLVDGSSNPFTAYHQTLLAYAGLQVGSIYSVGRIKKLTADSGKTLTDALIASLIGKFPTGFEPDVLFMSRRSLSQLQASRTATTPTGAPAPIPVESHGLPILVTDALSNVEALTL